MAGWVGVAGQEDSLLALLLRASGTVAAVALTVCVGVWRRRSIATTTDGGVWEVWRLRVGGCGGVAAAAVVVLCVFVRRVRERGFWKVSGGSSKRTVECVSYHA